MDADASRKIYIKLLKETNLGVARAFSDPQKIPFFMPDWSRRQTLYNVVFGFFTSNPKRDVSGQNVDVLS